MKPVTSVLRGCSAIIYGLLHVIVFTTPGFLLVFFAAAVVSCGDGTVFRNHVTRHTTWHGAFLAKIVTRILGVRITFRLPAPESFRVRRPFVIIANHQSIFDIPLICFLLWQMGLTSLRWILKIGLWWTPFGWAAFLTHCAFVMRRKMPRWMALLIRLKILKSRETTSEEDLLSVLRCGLRAFIDGASVILFPEGTRFRGSTLEPLFQYLAPPKLGGFMALLKAMPGADILSVTFCWSGGKTNEGLGRTTWDAFDLVGKSLHITVEQVARETVDRDPEAWLNAHWVQKGKDIASAATAFKPGFV